MTAQPTNLPVPAQPKAPLRAAGGGVQSIIPQDAEQAFRMAQLIAQSGMAPRDMQTPEKIVTAIIAGMEVGLKPFQAVQSIAVVNGRPTIWGDAALGLVQASGYLEDFQETLEGDGETAIATCRAKRTDRKTEILGTFSVADAKKAGLWGKQGPWTQYPKRMLQLRARAFALRDGFPDVLKGIGIREEVADYSGPSADRAAEAQTVTGQQLLAQAQNVDVPDALREHGQLAAAEAKPSTVEPAVVTLPDFPFEDGDRNGWLNGVRKQIGESPDQATLQAYGDALKPTWEDLPEIIKTTLTKAIRKRTAELSIETAGKPAA